MKNKFLMSLALASAVLFAGSAMAQTATTAASTVPSFKGAYVGVEGGVSSLAPATKTSNNLGLVYDGIGGYNVTFGQGWVTGVEASFGKKDTENYTVTAGGRIGHTLVSPTTLGYVKVAYANTNLDANGASGSLNGVQVGTGVETFLTQKISGRLEGDYTDYASRSFNGADVNPADVAVKAAVAYHF